VIASAEIQLMPRPSRIRSLTPYMWVPQVNRNVTAASPVSAASTAAARRTDLVGPKTQTSVMAASATAPAIIAAVTWTWLSVVCGAPGWSFGARPATTQAAA
jgi:hypothetical protein